MRTAEPAAPGPTRPRPPPRARRAAPRPPRATRWAWGALAVVLAGGLALRLWGVRQGLPFVYNIDEADHFVPRAVRMFARRDAEPALLRQPAGVHVPAALPVRARLRRRRRACSAPSRATPPSVYSSRAWPPRCSGRSRCGCCTSSARGCSAAPPGCWRRRSRRSRSCPCFYAHLALNDVPTLAPLTLSLLGTAGVLRKGRLRDYLLAGAGLGLACATKYTAGIVLVPLLGGGRRARCRGRARGAGGGALARSRARRRSRRCAAFLLANPYSVLDYSRFHGELAHQSSAVGRSAGQARRAARGRASSTTCGRSPGGSAGCRRSRRSAAR